MIKKLLKTFALAVAILPIFATYAIDVLVKNQSGRTAWIQFTGNALQVTPSVPTSINNGSNAHFNLTGVSSGRIYVSFDKALSSNAPDGANPNDPDYRTRFDKVELTYDQNTGGKANLTAVDFYGIPMILETSIEGITIEHLTLANKITGNSLTSALKTIALDSSKTTVIGGKNGTETVRVLSPVKVPDGYPGFDNYLSSVSGAQLKVVGTFFGLPSVNYRYKGTIGNTNIKLASKTHNIVIPLSTLKWNSTDTTNHNGIYTCNGPYTVDGVTHHVGDNDIYSAVYRDLITGFNLGFVHPGKNDSSTWWHNSYPFANKYYNTYAESIADNYPGAYGFPFSDRYTHILADLGGKVDLVTITLLDDSTAVPPYNTSGNINPQTGTCFFNLIIVTSNANFNTTTFTFNTKTLTGGYDYYFPSIVGTPDGSTAAAQVNHTPAQEGLNLYDFELGGTKYTILVKVKNGVIVWGSIAGGGDANWAAPNLFIGGVGN